MLTPNSRIQFQIPAGLESVRMHDENAVRSPGESEFLNSLQQVSHSAIMRWHATAVGLRDNRRSYVADSGERYQSAIQVKRSYRHRGPSGLLQGVVRILQDG